MQGDKQENRQRDRAILAGSGGSGFLVLGRDKTSFKGYWRAKRCPQAYTKLYTLYQSQEVVTYCGYVYDEAARRLSWQRLEVVISSWARHDHPDCLELQACAQQFNVQPSLN